MTTKTIFNVIAACGVFAAALSIYSSVMIISDERKYRKMLSDNGKRLATLTKIEEDVVDDLISIRDSFSGDHNVDA